MKTLATALLLLLTLAGTAQTKDEKAVAEMLNNWHKAAAEAKFDAYFGAMTKDSRFMGTDATENWNLDEFKAFSKPFFDKGKAWDFKPVERHIYFNADHTMAWFDELLDTWMKICRGSGVLRKENGQWKIAHYVLSMTVPNDVVEPVIKDKAAVEEAQLLQIKKKSGN